MPIMTDTEPSLATKRKYNDLSLDLNLDQVTADEAWANYDNIKLKYTLEVSLASVLPVTCLCYLVHLLPVTYTCVCYLLLVCCQVHLLPVASTCVSYPMHLLRVTSVHITCYLVHL